jgi:hypothetical protein
MPKKPKRQPMPPRPPLTAAQILAWADAHLAQTGEWPKPSSGPVLADPGEKWLNVNQALRLGLRGLPGGDSLGRLLERERGVRTSQAPPPLTEEKICRWAEAHCGQTENWPNEDSGGVEAAPGETWGAVSAALREGLRGLRGGDTLARLLARRLGVPHRIGAPRLTEGQIRFWAVDHERRTGRRPNAWSGPVLSAPGETWRLLDGYLRAGRRGLPGGSSLAKLLAPRGAPRRPNGGVIGR